MHALTQDHMEAVYQILKYLKGFPGNGLLYRRHDHQHVEVYIDADWAGSLADCRSTLGYCSFVGGNLVTKRSKKQAVVARSSAESEFLSLAHGIYESLWLKLLLSEVGFLVKGPICLYYDNKAAISIAHDLMQHDRTKHVEVDCHFIKDHLKKGSICTLFIQTQHQLADIFTKGLSGAHVMYLSDKLGMINIYSLA